MDKIKKIFMLIKKLFEKKFYGRVEVLFKAGVPVHFRKTEDINL